MKNTGASTRAQIRYGRWRTSSHSGANGECVAVAPAVTGVGVRDSRLPDGGVLELSPTAWRSVLTAVRMSD